MKQDKKSHTQHPASRRHNAFIRRAREVLSVEIEGLRRVRAALGREFSTAVDIMLECLGRRGKIVVTGIGKNLHIAEKIAATLASTGSTSVALNPAQAMHGDLGILNPEDVLLVLSYSGESDELLALLPIAKRLGVSVIAITGSPKSTLARHAAIAIPAAIRREACPFNMAPTASTTAALALGDAIAMVLLEARGFKREDYARFHPAGAIGRALLLKVSDIMRTGERLAVVRDNASVKDAILAMTRSRAGSAGVVDAKGRLKGIFTDGDLRRKLANYPNILAMPIRSVMTASPVTVREDRLAADILRVFEERNIDDILVVDRRGRLIGAVDIQDLPKLKIL